MTNYKTHKPHSTTDEITVSCGFCFRSDMLPDVFGGTVACVNFHSVQCRKKSVESTGPCGIMRQLFAIGKCDRCGAVHIVPMDIFSAKWTESEAAIRDENGSTGAIVAVVSWAEVEQQDEGATE